MDRETPRLLSPVVETVPALTRVMSPSRLPMPMPLAAKPEVATVPWLLTRMSPVWLVATMPLAPLPVVVTVPVVSLVRVTAPLTLCATTAWALSLYVAILPVFSTSTAPLDE
ncbi:hypothetical protein D3C80_1937050 [compost metagenome]